MTADVSPVTAAAVTYGQACAADAVAPLNAQISTLTAQVSTLNTQVTTLTSQLSAETAKYDAYVAAHPATPTAKLMVGTTVDGQTRASWPVVRAYNQSDALKVPSTAVPAVSYTAALGVGWSTDATKVASLKSSLAALPDKPGVRVCAFHEPEDNYGPNAAGATKFVADEVVFSKTVRAVSATRHNPLVIYRCLMGFSLMPAQSVRVPDNWVSGDFDEIGIDVYATAQIALSIAFAKKHGKPLCVPEMGPLNNIDHTDAAILAYMQAGVPAFSTAKAAWVSWFDKAGSGGDLSQYPNSLAYWKSQI